MFCFFFSILYRVDEGFASQVRAYAAENGISDLEFVKAHTGKPFMLHQMMMEAGTEVFR